MKILILGSVAMPVPPAMYGGTERVAYYQALGLSKRGHQVTLVAAKGSAKKSEYELVEIGGGNTVAGTQKATSNVQHSTFNKAEITESSRLVRKEAVYLSEVGQWLLSHGKDFDVILNNMRSGESFFVPLAKILKKPFINVTHLPLFKELADFYQQYNTPIITISNAQRKPFPYLNYVGTAYNPIDINDYSLGDGSGNYLLQLASIAPHKNQAAAIRVAKAIGMKLVLVGKIGNQTYFEKEIAPFVDGKKVVYIGEVGLAEKNKLYGEAFAFLFPIVWEEPFGLVMIEALACGTPVIAFNRGAIPEVIEDGKTGYVVNDESEMMIALKNIKKIDRAYCRAYVAKKFSVENMAESLDKALKAI
jgi:glycosyltransferase involved in cell wall biosynthesis